jgi:hypothetical protein
MDEPRPASVEYAAVIEHVLFGGEPPDRKREAIDREIEQLYENMRDYLEAENEAALQRARREAAFALMTDGKHDERAHAKDEYDAAHDAEKRADEEVERLKREHAREIYRLRVLMRIRELLGSPAPSVNAPPHSGL